MLPLSFEIVRPWSPASGEPDRKVIAEAMLGRCMQTPAKRATTLHPSSSCKSAGLGYRRSACSSRNSIHAFRNFEPLSNSP